MQKLLTICMLTIIVSGCSWIYKMDIEQGNIFTEEMVHRLHRGMSEEEVQAIMGTPILLNTFNENNLTYVYTMKPGGGKMTEKTVILVFNKQDLLQEIRQENFP